MLGRDDLPPLRPALFPIVVLGAASLLLPSSSAHHLMLSVTSIASCWSLVVCYSVRLVRTRPTHYRPGSTIVCAYLSKHLEALRTDWLVEVFSFCATGPHVQGCHSTRRFEWCYSGSYCSIERILGMQWNNWSFDVDSCKPWCPWNSLPNDRSASCTGRQRYIWTDMWYCCKLLHLIHPHSIVCMRHPHYQWIQGELHYLWWSIVFWCLLCWRHVKTLEGTCYHSSTYPL